MKNLLFLLLLSSCYISVGPEPFPNCVSDYDCMPEEICNYGYCEYFFTPYGSGIVINDCQCWDGFVYIGEVKNTNMCDSGLSVIEMCVGCCEYWYDECVKPLLGRFCL